MIRKAEEKDLEALAQLYKQAFVKHNIFEKPIEDIIEYLKKFLGDIIIDEEEGEIAGALIISSNNNKWKLTRFKHIAVSLAFRGKHIGSDLLKEAETITRTGKIEIHAVKEGDTCPIQEFYEKNGYMKEGELKSHYRENESCVIMGKIL